MKAMPADSSLANHALFPPVRRFADSVSCRVMLAVAAFVLYWVSAIILQSRGGTTHFGADAHLYSLLADGVAHERVARFHPLTTAMAAAWLKALSPLTVWVSPLNLLKAMFAAIGALGVWAAM